MTKVLDPGNQRYAPCPLRSFVKMANFFIDDTRFHDKRFITTEAFSEALSLRK